MIEHRLAKFYAEDHRRLDEWLSTYRRLKQKDPPKAKEALRNFRSDLEQHMAWEEAILFPEYNDRRPSEEKCLTEGLLSEHAEILNLLDRIEDKLAEPEPDTESLENRLLKTLAAHNRAEESSLYAELDNQLTEQERDEIFSKMKQSTWEKGS